MESQTRSASSALAGFHFYHFIFIKVSQLQLVASLKSLNVLMEFAFFASIGKLFQTTPFTEISFRFWKCQVGSTISKVMQGITFTVQSEG
jgi:uncharacterized membrane protein